MKPLVSVLLPTLWRFDKLKKSVESFYETAAHPERIEMIIRCHRSDSETVEGLVTLQGKSILAEQGRNIKVVVRQDKPAGYGNEWLWNQLRPLVTGEWLQYWSDDMTIEGESWDTQLAQITDKCCVVHPEIHQLGASQYKWDQRGPTPFVRSEAIQGDIPAVPDMWVYEEFVLRCRWPIHWLYGVTVNHNRDERDRTLTNAPVAH